MSVPKTTTAGITSRAGQPGESEGVGPREGEFESVLAEKSARRPGTGKPATASPMPGRGVARPGETGRETGGEGVDARGGERGPAGSEPRPASARDAAAQEALRGAGTEAFERAASGEARGLAGNLASPVHTRWEPASLSGAETSRSADAVAQVERIASEIVRAAEVRLHGDGAVEARLALDLGTLGRMNVALERTAEGRIRVTLEPTTAEARGLLEGRASELASRLEARGLHLQELRVETSGETVLRLAGSTTPAETAEVTSPAREPASGEPAARGDSPPPRERFDEERERRGRREPEATAEGEEED